MAGGMGLLAMTDMAVASEPAMFGLPEVKVGEFPMQVLGLTQDLCPQADVVFEDAMCQPRADKLCFDTGSGQTQGEISTRDLALASALAGLNHHGRRSPAAQSLA
jgi:hypothetical protein